VANGPRIIFVAATDGTGRGGNRGRWHPVGAYDEQSRYGWRLIGANNRELGRSPSTYDGLAEARAIAGTVRARAAELTTLVTNQESDGSWAWQAQLGGAVVAVSGRTYLRQRECQYNYQQFVVGIALAGEILSPLPRPRVRMRRLPTMPGHPSHTYRETRPDNGLPFEPAAP
jgi:hypothetical protein